MNLCCLVNPKSEWPECRNRYCLPCVRSRCVTVNGMKLIKCRCGKLHPDRLMQWNIL